METELTIDGQLFRLMGAQRSGTRVYRGETAFLRIGAPGVIARDLSYHRRMEAAHMPVPAILREGTHTGEAYFVEASLGEKSFRNAFAREYETTSVVTAAQFGLFLESAKKFFEAQLSTRKTAFNRDALATAIRLPSLISELPEYSEQMEKVFKLQCKRLALLPSVVTHGDLNPSNMYPSGVIDLEDSFDGPLGFDAISAIRTQDWFPDGDYEFTARFRLSDAQRAAYMSEIDALAIRHGAQPISAFQKELEFCRAIWLCAGMSAWPKTQEWRFWRFIHEFLHD